MTQTSPCFSCTNIDHSIEHICVLMAPELQITQVTQKREAYIVPINQHGKKDKKLSTRNSDAYLPALLPPGRPRHIGYRPARPGGCGACNRLTPPPPRGHKRKQ